jgi:hypothetical protein
MNSSLLKNVVSASCRHPVGMKLQNNHDIYTFQRPGCRLEADSTNHRAFSTG